VVAYSTEADVRSKLVRTLHRWWSNAAPVTFPIAPTSTPPTSNRCCPTWRVMVPCAGRKRPLDIERYRNEAAAQQTAALIASVIAHR
jgi:hypothetical protein